VYAAIAVFTLIASGTYLVAKGAMSEIAPLVLAFYRFCLASLVFLGLNVLRRDHFSFRKSEWPLLVFLGLLAIPLNQCMFLFGLSYTQPTHPALLFATTPVWVYLLSVRRGEEALSRRKTMGIIVALIGVLAFFMEKGITLKLDYLFGDSITMIAVWSWATYTVVGRPLVKRRGAMAVTSTSLIIGTLLYFPLGIYLALNFDYSNVGLIGWGGVAYTGILTSVVAYTLWYWTIKHIEPSKAAVFMNLQPVVTAILAYFLIGERLSGGSILSGIVILSGIYIAQRDRTINGA
jgi:drug/metabolite transporter (DMT)-like permease